jgi:hypothetical protein
MGPSQNTFESHPLSRLRLQISNWKMLPAVGTNAAAEINGDSARPLGNSKLSYRSLKLMRRGSDGRAIGDRFAAVDEVGNGPQPL